MEQRQVAVTMRTPGNDFELAAGFLHTEGLVAATGDVRTRPLLLGASARSSSTTSSPSTWPGRTTPTCSSATSTPRRAAASAARRRSTRSRCGAPPVAEGPSVSEAVVVELPDRLRDAQRLFDRTGGLHAAGLFDAEGRLLELREDVGRHNAVDKLVGHALLAGAAAAVRAGADGVGPAQLRDRAEGRGRGHPGRVRGVGPLEPGGRRGPAVRDDAGRLPARQPVQHLHRRGAHHPGE